MLFLHYLVFAVPLLSDVAPSDPTTEAVQIQGQQEFEAATPTTGPTDPDANPDDSGNNN